MALPADARHRWNLAGGGSVDVVDLGDALVIVPASNSGLRGLLSDAIESAGGYTALVAQIALEEPELA
jgi:hypothetical protein